MRKIQGGCLCGAVRYASDAEPVMAVLCHCTHCQRQSGGAFSVNVAIPKGSLVYSADLPAIYEDSGESGLAVHRRFCRKCGSPIVSEIAVTPTLDWLKAGTLDDNSWVQPSINTWCSTSQSWVSQLESLPKFPKGPPIPA